MFIDESELTFVLHVTYFNSSEAILRFGREFTKFNSGAILSFEMKGHYNYMRILICSERLIPRLSLIQEACFLQIICEKFQFSEMSSNELRN